MYLRMSSSTRYSTRGSRQWLTFEQIAQKYHSEDVARQICQAKEALDDENRRLQVRNHPDAPVP